MKIEVKYEDNFEDAKIVRQEVFMEEQGFCNEFDDIDHKAIHTTIYVDGQLAGCTRMFYLEDPTCIHIGRIALRKQYRNLGLGRKLVEASEQYYHDQKVSFVLDAQCRIKGFYERLGYHEIGTPFYDEMVLHIRMIKDVNKLQ